MSSDEQKIGVLIQKCDLELNPLVYHLTIKVFLVDSQNGESLMGFQDAVSTKPFLTYQHRSKTPIWDEILQVNYNFKEIVENKSTKLLFLFEVTDELIHSSTKIHTGEKTVRVAWGFLKPVASNGDLNVNKQVRLQLYKIRRNCSMSHRTCPVFHLYSAHERKKYPGSVYVTLKGIIPRENLKSHSTELTSTNESPGTPVTDTGNLQSEKVITSLDLTKWSRLPTQSCKIVNSKMRNISVSRRGASFVSFSHSGYHLACASFSHVMIIDTMTGEFVSKVNGHTGLIYEVAWSPDDTLILSVSADCSAIVWRVKPIEKPPQHVLPHPSFVYSGKWLPCGHRIVTGGKDSLIRYWSDGKLIQQIAGHTGFITSLEVQGQVMLSGDSVGCIRLFHFDREKWTLSRKLSLKELSGAIIDTLLLHPGQRRLVATSRGRGSFTVDIFSGIVTTSFKSSPISARCVSCLSPCGTLFFAFISQNVVNVWEFETGRIVATYANLFPDLCSSSSELCGCIAYHPHEHMTAFSILGVNYPVMVLKYDRHVDQSHKLGLTVHDVREKPNGAYSAKAIEPRLNEAASSTLVVADRQGGSSTEEKLAAIVRNIDQVFAMKRHLLSKLSRESF